MKRTITLDDGSALEVRLEGNSKGRLIMLPGTKESVTGTEAETLRLWGVDPELGRKLVDGLADEFGVIYFDYEGHLFQHPRPDSLTPEAIARDFLQIADEMGVNTFCYYGYSWLALAGLQLAIRTDRLEALLMGGFPPYDGPYAEMRTVTAKTHEQAVQNIEKPRSAPKDQSSVDEVDWDHIEVTIDPDRTKQFLTLYNHLTDFEDTAIQGKLCFPKLAFAGEKDTIVYGENFGGVTVDISGRLSKHEDTLRQLGWDVQIVQGEHMDHTRAMQPEVVLPLIKPWLRAKLSG